MSKSKYSFYTDLKWKIKMIKIIVSDLDGTLLNEKSKVSDFTLATIKKLIKQGAKFVIATGRHHNDISHLVEKIGGDIFYITSNGARVHQSNGQPFYSENLQSGIISGILALSESYDLHRNIYSDESWYVEKEPSEQILSMHFKSTFYYQIKKFSMINQNDIAKIFFVGEREKLNKLFNQLHEQYGDHISLTFSLNNILEVMAKDVSKGQALQLVLDHYQLAVENTMVFGDGMNDLDMLQLAGHPVLMENAHKDLEREIADHHRAPSHKNDGVAQFLTRYFDN
jgi:Cof subfamily protein (haloacid dehalogenase superfamily)